MRSFLIHWLITAVALAIGAHFIPGIRVTSLTALLFSAMVLGVVNGAAFALAAALVPGFTVMSLGSAMAGALVVSIVSWVLGWLLNPIRDL